ncbi:hypothetical protein Ccar_03985 [Clostridium carboxidivorans P7]|uniref:N-acetyltransferase domain-containing protein n=1 Tax=Clostridium carboxidivorans P7 TaxID=536227 RepID=C6PRW3_9CLOT|nr:GNAT family N-acetyltransferase [Clostridium carboxidivorans]AKN30029.1 hypothetical protein Ccar_03985 [Clostridium carboxidivorans P7]EET88015.1 hypothetical protein CcarbDRAFT_1530 [Clostridium carboxidivorans P7]EFG89029.1 hypothetical protein CLCAR_1211 [Clostridium carboxidivorans P7]
MNFNENYEYEVCSPNDEKTIVEMAKCLAETFTGVQVGSTFIKEPMSIALNLSKEALTEFVIEYLKYVTEDGLSTYAIDTRTGELVGAIACENFNPKEEPPILKGELKSINGITQFLWQLDKKFIEVVEFKTNQEMKVREYVHPLMLGVRTERDKKYIGASLVQLILDTAKEKGFKGAIVEATNFRSQMLASKLLGFYTIDDIHEKPISIRYEDNEMFNSIPENIASECMLMYKPLDEKFRL